MNTNLFLEQQITAMVSVNQMLLPKSKKCYNSKVYLNVYQNKQKWEELVYWTNKHFFTGLIFRKK